jgi:hypothetical protein
LPDIVVFLPHWPYVSVVTIHGNAAIDLCSMQLTTKRQLMVWALVSLTLGLAPFVPEPHIIGKIRWVAGGAIGMTGMDWFDLLFHGFPWLFLVYWAVRSLMELRTGA